MKIKLLYNTCPVCDSVFSDHSNTQLKKCLLIISLTEKELIIEEIQNKQRLRKTLERI